VHPQSSATALHVHKAFLARLATILPYGCIPVLITDAGFRESWFKLVNQIGWHWFGLIRNPIWCSPMGDAPWTGCKALSASAADAELEPGKRFSRHPGKGGGRWKNIGKSVSLMPWTKRKGRVSSHPAARRRYCCTPVARPAQGKSWRPCWSPGSTTPFFSTTPTFIPSANTFCARMKISDLRTSTASNS
jgi:hypothetical protein